MNRHLLLAYQLLTGLAGVLAALMLLFAPALALPLFASPASAGLLLPFFSWSGAFLLSCGFAALYGAWIVQTRRQSPAYQRDQSRFGRRDRARLETIWIVTSVNYGLIFALVLNAILHHTLPRTWFPLTVMAGLLAAFQVLGLVRDWIQDAR